MKRARGRRSVPVLTVLMHLDLPQMSRSGKPKLSLPFERGMTTNTLLHHEFRPKDRELILVVVNGEHVVDETPLADGDTVEFMHPMVGG